MGARTLTASTSSGRWRPRASLVFLGSGLPILFVAASALDALTDGARIVAGPAVAIVDLLPIDAAAPDVPVAVLSAIGLLALVVGLVRGKRLSWLIAVSLYAFTLVSNAVVHWQPISAVLSLAGLAALVLAWRRFDVRTEPIWWRRTLASLAAAGTLLALITIGIILSGAGSFPIRLEGAWAAVGATLGARADVARAGEATLDLLAPSLVVGHVLIVLASLSALVSVRQSVPSSVEDARARSVLGAIGGGALVPFQLGSGVLRHAGPSGRSAFAYGIAGRSTVILGDPVGPTSSRWDDLTGFVAESRRDDRVVGIYQASDSAQAPLRQLGWHLFKIGDEAVLDLASFDLSGSARANLRHTVTRSRRARISVQWFPTGLPGIASAHLRAELTAIDRAWHAHRGPDLTFSISRFDEADLDRVAIAIALSLIHI